MLTSQIRLPDRFLSPLDVPTYDVDPVASAQARVDQLLATCRVARAAIEERENNHGHVTCFYDWQPAVKALDIAYAVELEAELIEAEEWLERMKEDSK